MKSSLLALTVVAALALAVAAIVSSTAGDGPPTAAGSAAHRWGDLDCTRTGDPADVSRDDLFALLQFLAAGEAGELSQGCPLLGSGLLVTGFGALLFGDSDCSGGISGYDALVLLLSIAALLLAVGDCPDIGEPFDYVPALADVKVLSFGIEASPPYTFPAGVLEPFSLKLFEAKHNNGPVVAPVEVLWTVEKKTGEPFVGFRWAAEPGDVCTQDGEVVPCGEGDVAGGPSIAGDNCFDGIDNDDNGTADLFGTGQAATDPNLPFDPQCAYFINDLHFEIEPPVSASFTLDRFLAVQCNTVGEFVFLAVNVETVKPPYADPEPTNNARSFEEEATCE